MDTQNPSGTPSKLVIFIPNSIPGLEHYISTDTNQKFSYIHSSSLDSESLAEISRRGKTFMKTISDEPNPDFNQAAFDNAKSKKTMLLISKALHDSIPLIIIEEKALIAEDYTDLKKDMETKYGPNFKYNCLYVVSCTSTGEWEEGVKTLFFISGNEFGLFADLLTKGNKATSQIILNADKKGIDNEFVPAALNDNRYLLVVDTTNLLLSDEEFCSRVGIVGKYVVTQHIVLPGAVVEKQQKAQQTDTSQQNDSSIQNTLTIESIAVPLGIIKQPGQSLRQYYALVVRKWFKLGNYRWNNDEKMLLKGKEQGIVELQDGQPVWDLKK